MQNEEKLSVQNEQAKKPKWLRKLEQESWQAELIISGAAIYGSLQLPYYINKLVDFCITFFQPENYFIVYFFFIYLFCASTFLIICFVTHFVLRAIWIGMLGLNYVFPNGINYDFDQYSPTFLKKLKERFPNNHQDIIGLEKMCSAMFGIATSVLMIMISININILILFGLKTVLSFFVPSEVLFYIMVVLAVFMFIFYFVMYFLNLKRFHQNEKLQTWYFNIAQALGKFNYHILYYPITRISYLFVTNSSIKKFTFGMFAIFFAMGIITTFQMVNSNILLITEENALFREYDRTDKMIATHYDSNLDGSEKLFSATIPSERIHGDLMRVFVPVFRNEKVQMDSLCGEWQKDKNLSDAENRRKKRERWRDCAQKYHQFYVNDSLYTSELVHYEHPNQGEDGVLTYLPTEKFKLGKNILRIEKVKKDGTVYRRIRIPFWY